MAPASPPFLQPLQLRFTSGASRGRAVRLTKSPVRVGRSRDNDIVLPEEHESQASGRHAEFRYENGAWWVVDLESTNGTRLNGTAVRRAQLHAGDRVGFGEVTLAVARPAHGPLRLALVVAALLVTAAATGYVAWQRSQGPLDRIAAAGSRSAFFILLEENGRVLPVGTAFAVDASGRLATNAHVAAPLAEAVSGARPGVAYAVAHDAPGERRRIVGATVHPRWRPGSIENDVALVQLEPGRSTIGVRLADSTEIQRLAGGTPVAIYGFPAAFTDSMRPRGSIAANVVRELRGTSYLVVDIAVAPGSSGSPVFAYDGSVVGIVAGSSLEGIGGATPAVALTTVALADLLK